MRRLLGSALPTLLPTLLPAVLLAGLLGGCGDDESGTATDDPAPPASSSPASSSPASSSPADEPTDHQPGDAVEFELVETITETDAGGSTSPAAIPLGDDAAVETFVADFSEGLQTKVQEAVDATDVPDGMQLYGAVIAVGCDAPTEVAVTQGDAGLEVHALKVPSPLPECFAAMTTVALVLVPASAAG